MKHSFPNFVEAVLCKAGERQKANSCYSVSLLDVLGDLNVDPFEGWVEQVIPYLEKQGWAEDDSTHQAWQLRVTGLGFVRIAEIAERDREKGIVERISSVSRSDWIAILALITSIVALFK